VGARHLDMGLADALMDSLPLVAIPRHTRFLGGGGSSNADGPSEMGHKQH
jgi:hypothetical protein